MLVLSDLHLDNHTQCVTPGTDSRYPGCNSRAIHILEAVRRAYKYAAENGHRWVVIPGDVFHRRGVLYPVVANPLCRIIDEYRKSHDILTVMLPGNHDYVDKHALYEDESLHALYTMSGGNIVVVSEQSLFRIKEPEKGEVIASFIPYTPSRDRWVKMARSLGSLGTASTGDGPRLLFAHQSFDGARVGPIEIVMREGVNPGDVPEDFDAVISGHYHLHQQLGPVLYVGGLLQHNFGERDYTPGWLVVENGNWTHFEDTQSPRFVVYEGEDADAVTHVLTRAKDRGDYVQIRWTGRAVDGRDLLEEARSDSRVSVTEVTPPVVGSVRLNLADTSSSHEILKKYVSYIAASGIALPATEEEILAVGRELLNTAHRGGSV